MVQLKVLSNQSDVEYLDWVHCLGGETLEIERCGWYHNIVSRWYS
jgi:hypothetical protein